MKVISGGTLRACRFSLKKFFRAALQPGFSSETGLVPVITTEDSLNAYNKIMCQRLKLKA